ncbi:hypothetical protein B0A48_07672 [Cryoendolithus antarcticus]|uniref:GH16 domain-containing protein n=1 Tax=Cryoendolithus antarcticus TaxID=1507870 RepID=A0A1V8T734_9PEZI|nr:hypothetical protein B0A48_07672 [Cryoendolithus antarcticus]
MLPVRPDISRSSSRSSAYVDAEDDRQPQQAGRSTTNLNAAASAQALREASRSRPSSRGPSRSSSQPNLLRKKSRQAPGLAGSNVAAIPESDLMEADTDEGLEMPRHPPSHAPAVSSPLVSTPSNSSGEAADSRKSSNEAQDDAARPWPLAGRSKVSLVPPGTARSGISSTRPTRPNSYLFEMAENDSSLSLTRQQTPKTLRDLGSDYTRYYNPFSSNNNSQSDLLKPMSQHARTANNSSTHLMASNAMSSTDLHKRLSDPFNDEKRLSNPFDRSLQGSTPGTPNLQKQNSNDRERDAKAAVAGGAAGAAILANKPGTPAMISDADPEKTPFFPFVDDRLGAPEYSFPLFTDAKEDDDDLHMPMWDDDIRLKAGWRDRFARENIVSTIGMIFMVSGLLCIFIVLPVISYTGTNLIPYGSETPLDQMPGAWQPIDPSSWAYVNARKYPLIKNMRTGLIDPDTPKDVMTKTDRDGNTLKLVFSDEFNEQNRSFYPGDDPYWYAPDIWYGATRDMEWYDPDAVNTGDGTLQLQLDEFASHGLNYRSGMLNSWNQLCFKGGMFEISASLPGPGGVHGLWPGAWTMGNLGRPGYLATTDGMWPYTYNDCDVGITPNQSHTDGLNYLPGQRLASCTCEGQEHPTPGTGRGAPEIDIIEVSGDWGGMGVGVATQSFQVAPFDIWWYPEYEFMQTPNYSFSMVNTYTGGPFQQAVSTTSMLNNDWYDGKAYQKYAFEYAPGSDEDAYIKWTVGDDEMMTFDARALGPNGNIGQRMVSEEPMTMIINLGFSEAWVNIDWANLKFPTVYRVDYVRWYQREDFEMVTCDPPGYETTDYIAQHPKAYNNPNYTHWEDAGYSWPQNTLMDGCSA